VDGGETASRQRDRRVYLDMCALNRPLDDQNQMRIRLEADAVLLILGHVRARTISMVVSPAHVGEVEANPEVTKREHILLVLKEIGVESTVDGIQVRRRAEELHGMELAPPMQHTLRRLSWPDATS